MAEAEILRYTGYALAAMAVWIVLRCVRSLVMQRPAPLIWACLVLPGVERLPLR